jgi:AtzH-like
VIVNDPRGHRGVSALYPRHEEALVNNDVENLLEMFCVGRHVMRFGASENLYGPEELAAFRRARPAASLARTVACLEIVSFRSNFARIPLEFERTLAAELSRMVRGRKSQVRVRLRRAGASSRPMFRFCRPVDARRAKGGEKAKIL